MIFRLPPVQSGLSNSGPALSVPVFSVNGETGVVFFVEAGVKVSGQYYWRIMLSKMSRMTYFVNENVSLVK